MSGKSKLGFDVNADLIPIGLIGNEAMIIAASPKLGVANLADLIALAGKQPHRIIIERIQVVKIPTPWLVTGFWAAIW